MGERESVQDCLKIYIILTVLFGDSSGSFKMFKAKKVILFLCKLLIVVHHHFM